MNSHFRLQERSLNRSPQFLWFQPRRVSSPTCNFVHRNLRGAPVVVPYQIGGFSYHLLEPDEERFVERCRTVGRAMEEYLAS